MKTMKNGIGLTLIVLMVFSLAFAACASTPREEASPEEIAAAEAEVEAAEERLRIAADEAREATELARAEQSQENIANFFAKREAWEEANRELDRARSRLRRLRP